MTPAEIADLHAALCDLPAKLAGAEMAATRAAVLLDHHDAKAAATMRQFARDAGFLASAASIYRESWRAAKWQPDAPTVQPSVKANP